MNDGFCDLSLGPDAVMRLLPHRPPFLMVDRVTAIRLQAPPALRACRFLSANEAVFAGHFPGLGVFPGALILEGLAQSCALLAILRDRLPHPSGEALDAEALDSGALRDLSGTTPQTLGVIGACNLKFIAPVLAGCRLDYEVELDRSLGDAHHFRMSASVEGRPVARGTLSAGSMPVDRKEPR